MSVCVFLITLVYARAPRAPNLIFCSICKKTSQCEIIYIILNWFIINFFRYNFEGEENNPIKEKKNPKGKENEEKIKRIGKNPKRKEKKMHMPIVKWEQPLTHGPTHAGPCQEQLVFAPKSLFLTFS